MYLFLQLMEIPKQVTHEYLDYRVFSLPSSGLICKTEKKIPNSLLVFLKSNVLTKTKHTLDYYIKSLKGYSNSFKIYSITRILHAEGRSVAQPLPQPAPEFAVAQKCTQCTRVCLQHSRIKGIRAAFQYLKNTTPCSQLLFSSTSAAGTEPAHNCTGFEANTAQVVLVTHL